MQNFRNKLIASGAVLILAAIGTMMNRQSAQAQAGTTVTIGAPIPLPVEARQVGPWNVGLTGTQKVIVANGITDAVPVHISQSSSQHVELVCPESPPNNSVSVPYCGVVMPGDVAYLPSTAYEVPVGQNLLVTSADIRGLFFGGGSLTLGSSFPPAPAVWTVPSDNFTHSFQYPNGILFPGGFVFDNKNLVVRC